MTMPGLIVFVGDEHKRQTQKVVELAGQELQKQIADRQAWLMREYPREFQQKSILEKPNKRLLGSE